ncbi:hypothetical protein Trydic_g22806 [Trypoxylus dichotomus]
MKEDNPNLDQRVVGMLQHISDDLLNIQEIPLILQNHELVNAVFESCWYLTSPRTRKLLLIMMIGAGRPIRMTAGKFVFLSLESFMSIIRGAGSYFTVLKNTKGSASKE